MREKGEGGRAPVSEGRQGAAAGVGVLLGDSIAWERDAGVQGA